MEKWWDNTKSALQSAYHTVIKSPRSFLPFFLAILLVESLFLTVFLSYEQNAKAQTQAVTDGYQYHIKVMGLSEAEMLLLKNDERSVFGNDRNFRTLSVERYESTYYDDAYSLSMLLLTGNKDYGIWGLFRDDSLAANYEAVCTRYSDVLQDENNHVTLYFSPLYTLESDLHQLTLQRNAFLLATAVISVVFLLLLYRIYAEDQRFLFGIYAVFGGTSKKMRGNSLYQLLFCGLFTLLPAYYLSSLLCSLFYRLGGSSYSFSLLMPRYLIFTFLMLTPILWIAVCSPVKALSRKEPMLLLSGEDNGDKASSPSASRDMRKWRMPFGYEILAAMRFRKHYVALALSSALVCTVFFSGSYLSQVYQTSLTDSVQTAEDFLLYFDEGKEITDSDLALFADIKGTKSVYRNYSNTDLEERADLLLIPQKQVVNTNGFHYDKQKTSYLTGDAKYTVATPDVLQHYRELYTLVGDPDALFEDDHNIILSSSYNNALAFQFSPGDTVQIAVADRNEENEIVFLTDDDTIDMAFDVALWKQQWEKISYHIETFTVVAVIDDYPSGANGIPLLLNADMYETLSGQSAAAGSISICVDYSNADNHSAVLDKLLQYAAKLNKMRVLITGRAFSFANEQQRCMTGLFTVLSSLLLLFLPIYWFYTQSLFYKKREQEFDILHALGASPQRIRSLYVAGALSAIPAAVLSLAFSAGAIGILYLFWQCVLPNVFRIKTALAGGLSLSAPLLFAVLLLYLFCSTLSCLLPYFRYRRAFYAAFSQDAAPVKD